MKFNGNSVMVNNAYELRFYNLVQGVLYVRGKCPLSQKIAIGICWHFQKFDEY